MTDHTMATTTASARVKPDADPGDLADLIAWLEEKRVKAVGRVPTTRTPANEGGGDG